MLAWRAYSVELGGPGSLAWPPAVPSESRTHLSCLLPPLAWRTPPHLLPSQTIPPVLPHLVIPESLASRAPGLEDIMVGKGVDSSRPWDADVATERGPPCPSTSL